MGICGLKLEVGEGGMGLFFYPLLNKILTIRIKINILSFYILIYVMSGLTLNLGARMKNDSMFFTSRLLIL